MNCSKLFNFLFCIALEITINWLWSRSYNRATRFSLKALRSSVFQQRASLRNLKEPWRFLDLQISLKIMSIRTRRIFKILKIIPSLMVCLPVDLFRTWTLGGSEREKPLAKLRGIVASFGLYMAPQCGIEHMVAPLQRLKRVLPCLLR